MLAEETDVAADQIGYAVIDVDGSDRPLSQAIRKELDTVEGTIRTRIPARLDRLPWSRFHWRIVIGLGTIDTDASGSLW